MKKRMNTTKSEVKHVVKRTEIGDVDVAAAFRKLGYPLTGVDEAVMDPTQIGMITYVRKDTLREGIKGPRSPRLEYNQMPTAYPMEFVFDVLKTMKSLGATHIAISYKQNTPLSLCCNIEVAEYSEGALQTRDRRIEFVLAPRIESSDYDVRRPFCDSTKDISSDPLPEAVSEAVVEVPPIEVK